MVGSTVGLVAVLVAAAAGPVTVAQPELRGANVARASLDFFGEHLAGRLRAAGVTVITQREIDTLLGFDRQKALLGCDEAGACIAELANALGTDGVLVGDVGHFGDVYQVELKVISGVDAKVLASVSERVSSEQEVLDVLSRGARQLSRQVYEKLKRPVPAAALVEPDAAQGKRGSVRSASLVPAIVGGAFVIAGGVLLGLASADYQALIGPGDALALADAQGLANGGSLKKTLGIVSLAVGGAALVTAVIMFAVGGGNQAPLAIVPAPTGGGAMVVWSGALR